ncbi:tRNA(Ile)-lysidine synthase [Mariniblastus fucicola]|uniref:tRNA(Ile)-lysidine synthase n=2 Tax=Mariniblastus fucicola TaxID=980251 RepID=A0A5B9PM20_9BACT|nr:tRNA(Ile)-lysidine synthase [Mariniblastus fucicola]
MIEQIQIAWPCERWLQFNVLVAVSGGADSVALLRALHAIGLANAPSPGSLVVAHFNHGLRGAESDGDADFVRQLTDQLGLKFCCGHADPDCGASGESELRNQRYEFLVRTARKTNCRYIATAHHRDDQVETVLFRLFRGTGVRGLAGIPPFRVVDESLTIVRPMLEVSRDELEQALRSWNQPWRTDATNQNSEYSRNFIRNDVFPMLRERFGSVDDSVVRLANQAAEQHAFLVDQTLGLFKAVTLHADSAEIDCQQLERCPAVLLRELFMQIFRHQSWPISQLGFRELDRLAQLVLDQSNVPLFQLPGAIGCEKVDGTIRLSQ